MQAEMLLRHGVNDEKTPRGLDKIQRYEWKLADEPGVFLEIPKGDLLVDNSYQRHGTSTKESKVIELAKNWSWVACGVIVVVERGDGWYVVDGWHRVLGARKRSDIKLLPCMVFRELDIKEEAAGFLRSNTLRKPLHSVYRYHAMLVAGDEKAKWVRGLLEKAGRRAAENASAQTISCISALFASWPFRDDLDRIWPTFIRLTEGRNMHNVILQALVYIESHLADGKSITDRDIERRILKCGMDELLKGVTRAIEYRSKGGTKVWAEGVLNALNHRHSKKLELTN